VQTSWNQAHAPHPQQELSKDTKNSARAFQRHKEHGFEASPFSGSHNYKTKQNNLPSFIDRYGTLSSVSSLNNSQK
jgi:hypothetical protein